MESFTKTVKRIYESKGVSIERMPVVSGEKFIALQLVEFKPNEQKQQQDNEKKKAKRTPILYSKLFNIEDKKNSAKKIVIVEGSAGIGKTTLCLMLAKGWAKERVLMQFNCVLLLPLRETVVSSARDLCTLLKLFYADESDQRCKTVTDNLRDTDGDGVLIVADGWDELSKEARAKGSFLYNLLFENILPSASIIVTSRYSAATKLHYDINNNPNVSYIEVVGFNEENVKEFVKSEFSKNPEKGLSLIEQLENNPLIQSVCSIPLNCAIICNIWRKKQQKLPATLTELYHTLVLNIIEREVSKSSQIQEIESFDSMPEILKTKFKQTCMFAYKFLINDQIVFTKSDVKSQFPEISEHEYDVSELCLGLLQSTDSLLFKELTFHFPHLTIQEFLAAVHIATRSKQMQMKIVKSHTRVERFSMVWKFLFGLGQTRKHYSKDIIQLDEHFLDNFLSYIRDEVLILCHLASEFKSDLFSLKVARRINGQFKKPDNPHDCAAIFHVLRNTAPCSDIDLDLSGCNLKDKQLEELAKIFSHAGNKLLVQNLSINKNKLTDKGINFLLKIARASLSKLETLDCKNNDIEKLVLPFSTNITDFCASNNPFGGQGILSLATAIDLSQFTNLTYLTLSSTFVKPNDNIGEELNKLLTAIVSQCSQLTNLDISKNWLGEHGAYAVGKALPSLSNGKNRFTLNVEESNISNAEATSFSNGVLYSLSLQSSDLPIKKAKYCCLTFCTNPVGYEGLSALFRMLGGKNNPITDLDLDKVIFDFESDHCIQIEQKQYLPQSCAATSSSSLTALDLNAIKSSEGAHISILQLAVKEGVLCNLELLNLSETFTDNPDTNGLLLATLLEPLSIFCLQLKSIDLSSNKFGVVAASVLGKTIPMFTRSRDEFKIDLRIAEFNSEAISEFCTLMILNSEQENGSKKCEYEVDFQTNPLGYNGLVSIFKMLMSVCCPITSLNLSKVHDPNVDTNINDSLCAEIDDLNTDLPPIPKSSKIKTLYLEENKDITDSQHIECLTKVVQHGFLTNLEQLHLSNTLSEDLYQNEIVLKNLLPAIASHCSHLTELDLSDNLINENGAIALGERFPHFSRNTSKFELNLSNCNLNYVAIQAFSDHVIDTLSYMPELSMAQFYSECVVKLKKNPFGYEGMMEILKLLQCKNCPITYLDLDQTVPENSCFPKNIPQKHSSSDTLHTNYKLAQLEICENSLTGKKVSMLIEYFKVCQSLEEINCSGCSLATSDIRSIICQLKCNGICLSYLRNWNVSECCLDDEGVQILSENQPFLFPCLGKLDLDKNSVSLEVEKMLTERLKVTNVHA